MPAAVVITTECLRETRLTRAALGMPGLEPLVTEHPASSITIADVATRVGQTLKQA